MLNYLSKFLPNISHITETLGRLTDHSNAWKWLPEHEIALEKIRKLLSQEPCLRFYVIEVEITIESDASQFGLGAV